MGTKQKVPIDRLKCKFSNKMSNNILNIVNNGGIHYTKLLQQQPRRLSLSVSSMTSDASYSRSSIMRNPYNMNLYQYQSNGNNNYGHQGTKTEDTINSEIESITKTFGNGSGSNSDISPKHKIKRIHPNIDTNRGTSNGKNLKNEQVQRQREELMILN